MIETDGRDSAKCRKSKLKDIDGIFGILNDNKDEIENSVILFPLFKRLKT